MITVPAPVPELRIDLNTRNLEHTGVTIIDNLPIFRFQQNSILGINFFGKVPNFSVDYQNYLAPSFADILVFFGPNDQVTARFIKGIRATGVLVQDILFGGPNYHVTDIKVNGLNILAAPLLVNNANFIPGVMIDPLIIIPENSGTVVIVDNPIPPAPFFLQFTGTSISV
jgi:hypothetical protein